MRHSRIKYCKSNESISFEKMIFSPRGKCAFFALKIISIFLILLLTFISWTSIRKNIPLLFSTFLGQIVGGSLKNSQKIHIWSIWTLPTEQNSLYISVHFLLKNCRLCLVIYKKSAAGFPATDFMDLAGIQIYIRHQQRFWYNRTHPARFSVSSAYCWYGCWQLFVSSKNNPHSTQNQ